MDAHLPCGSILRPHFLYAVLEIYAHGDGSPRVKRGAVLLQLERGGLDLVDGHMSLLDELRPAVHFEPPGKPRLTVEGEEHGR